MYDFEYQRPSTLKEAIEALEKYQDGKPLAGGMSIVPVMRHRLAQPAALIDLNRVEELKGISEDAGRLRIGAMTNHYSVARSDLVKARLPALAQLAGGIGDPLVRNRGTIGGSLSHNDPAACYPSSVLGLGATVHTNKRDIPADEFIVATFTTALTDNEIITAVSFPIPIQAAYIKFINSSSRFSIVGIFLARTAGGVRIGVTGAGHHAFRPSVLERVLSMNFSPDAARAVNIPSEGLISDLHGTAEYRAYLIAELAARAVEHCLAGTPGAIM